MVQRESCPGFTTCCWLHCHWSTRDPALEQNCAFHGWFCSHATPFVHLPGGLRALPSHRCDHRGLKTSECSKMSEKQSLDFKSMLEARCRECWSLAVGLPDLCLAPQTPENHRVGMTQTSQDPAWGDELSPEIGRGMFGSSLGYS